jgi:hypothetical protein
MKYLILLSICVASLQMHAQEVFDGHKWEAPYQLPEPNGWGIERFPLPLSFAPQISFKGMEDIRFAPGWANAKSEWYWSYAFLWWLDGNIKASVAMLDSNLKAYYTGLVGINGRNIPAEKLVPVQTSFREIDKDQDDLETYLGTVRMTDYMTQQPIILNCKVHRRICDGENKTYIFFELSPQPLSHIIWSHLDKLWLGFGCKKFRGSK